MHATRLENFPRGQEFESFDSGLEENDLDMPNRLYWRPICDNDEPLDNQLKYILMEQDLLTNGLLTVKELGLLKGIRVCAEFLNHKEVAESAGKVIEAIESFGTIQVYSRDGL